MKMKKYICLAVIAMILSFPVSGFAWFNNYGKIRLQPWRGEKMTVQKLKEKWQDYTIYYSGMSTDFAGSIMFDPKDDERDLERHKWWDPVKDKEELEEIVFWINTYYDHFYPRVWRVLGPDNQFYGFMYTAHDHVLIRVVDNKTMWVDEMVLPPHIHDEAE